METLTFKQFLLNEERMTAEQRLSDHDVASMYFGQYPNVKIRDIAYSTGRSVAEIYRIIHRHGGPNRLKNGHENVLSLAQSGLPPNRIAELTGYTPRNIWYILKKNRINERM